MVFAHPFSDIVVNKILRPVWKKKWLTKSQETVLWIAGIISTVTPDFDLVYAVLTHSEHRGFITHTFVPYVIIALVVITLSFVFQKKLLSLNKEFLEPRFIRLITFIAFIGVSLHLLTDTLGAPVRLLYPFSSHEFISFPISSILSGRNLSTIFQYYTTPLFFLIELLWISSGSVILFNLVKKNIYIKKYMPQALGLIVGSAITMFFIVLFAKTP